MISQQQAIALRMRLVEAFATPGRHEPTITAAAIVLAPDELPADAPLGVRLELGDATPLGLEAEQIHRAEAGVLREVVRQLFEQRLVVRVFSRPSSSAPRLEQRASYLARRVLAHYARSYSQDALARVGIGILRVDGPRDLSRLFRSTQWTSVAQVELVLSLQTIDNGAIDWIERAEGTGTMTDNGGGTLVIPWTSES